MSTREKRIEGYVHKDAFNSPCDKGAPFRSYEFVNSVKATLIISEPEPEIKLTESRLDELRDHWLKTPDEQFHSFDEYLKARLFGGGKEGK